MNRNDLFLKQMKDMQIYLCIFNRVNIDVE